MLIGLISNPKSGRGRGSVDLVKFLHAAEANQHRVLHRPTTSIEELAATLLEYKREQIEVLAILGGDGTIRTTLDQVIHIWGESTLPAVLPLGGGTMNVLVASINPKHTPYQRFERFCAAKNLYSVNKQRLPMLQISHGSTLQHGFIFFAGTAVRFLESYYQHPVPGAWHAWSLIGRTIGSLLINGRYSRRLFAGLSATTQVDDEPRRQGEFSVIAACTVKQSGLGFAPFYLAQQPNSAGICQPHFLLCPSGKRSILMNIGNFYCGCSARKNSGILNLSGSRLALSLKTATTMSLDGDLLPLAANSTIAAGPFVDLLTP